MVLPVCPRVFAAFPPLALMVQLSFKRHLFLARLNAIPIPLTPSSCVSTPDSRVNHCRQDFTTLCSQTVNVQKPFSPVCLKTFTAFFFPPLLFHVVCGSVLTAQLQHLTGGGCSPFTGKHCLCSQGLSAHAKGEAVLNSLSTCPRDRRLWRHRNIKGV